MNREIRTVAVTELAPLRSEIVQPKCIGSRDLRD